MPEQPEPIGLLLSDDMLFTSRIVGEAQALGLTVQVARSVDALVNLARQQRPRCVIVDLANPSLVLADLFRRLGELGDPVPRVVAYGSHVDAEGLRAARAAGCEPVLARSKFIKDLPNTLPGWFVTQDVPPLT